MKSFVGTTWSWNKMSAEMHDAATRKQLWPLIRVIGKSSITGRYGIIRKLTGKPLTPISYYTLKRYYMKW